MADDNLFAAVPADVQAGGGVTDEVGQHAKQLSSAYEQATYYDLNDPPWGQGDDTAHTFEEKYVQPHADLRDALSSLAEAIGSAAQQTIDSGKGFAGAQDEALSAIHAEGGGHGGGRL